MGHQGVRVPMSLDVLEAEICRRSANVTAAELEWLLLVAEFDDRQGWVGSGAMSCAAWLCRQVGLDMRAAREKVRVAHALQRFERFADAMAVGALPYAKARALTRVATLDTEEALLDVAMVATSNQVERLCAAMRRREPDALDSERRAHAGRGVWVRHDDAELEFTIRLPVEAGKALLASIDMFVSNDDLTVKHASRRADAVITMAEHAVAHFDEAAGSEPRYLVSVHVDDDVFDGDDRYPDPDSQCAASAGDSTGSDVAVGVPTATAKRLLCDAVVEGLLEGDSGQITKVGERQRVPNRRLRRLILLRDGGCRFPGCDRKGWVDVHHIVHWLDHGPTVEGNLVSLCRFHHRLMHEGGWSIKGRSARSAVLHTW